jgi:SAM-dependent methyltransferase
MAESSLPQFYNQEFLHHALERRQHWDMVAAWMDRRRKPSQYYHNRLAEIYRFLVPPGQKILEVGCGQGDLLAALNPRSGLGIDLSHEMVRRAKRRHPELDFIQADGHRMPVTGTFDVIILSDLLNDVWDVQTILQQVRALCTPHTRLMLNVYSRLWEFPLRLIEKLGLAKPNLDQNWLTVEDVGNLLNLAGFENIKTWPEILFPLSIPLVSPFLNRVLARIWPLQHLCLTNFLFARPAGAPHTAAAPRVSVIIPARNEAGNIQTAFERIPEMGSGVEIVFVEGGSSDETYATIQACIEKFPQRQASLYQQTGRGKGDAVRLGFSKASGDILMILDADLTVAPEDLPRFYAAIMEGHGDFINGVRLVYPMQEEAMQFFNTLGNKFFSLALSWELGQEIKDTLCGTKVLWKADYERIVAGRGYFGDFDPFGDFDLIFGAAKLGLKIVDMPIRYRSRTYGSTNIQRWKHGWVLLKMVAYASIRLKFV